MKLLKSVILATTLALTLGMFSTSAFAACKNGVDDEGRSCTPFPQAVKMIDEHISMAVEAIEEERDTATILKHIKQAKALSKEINENDKVDIARGKANTLLRKAKSAVKKGQMTEGEDALKAAKVKFASLDGLRTK